MKLNPLSDRVIVKAQKAEKKQLQVLFFQILQKKNLKLEKLLQLVLEKQMMLEN